MDHIPVRIYPVFFQTENIGVNQPGKMMQLGFIGVLIIIVGSHLYHFSVGFPEIKTNLTAVYNINKFSFDARLRWIDSMKNRAAVQFPGETSFTGVPSVTYLDLGATWNFWRNSSLRIGVNNVADKQPPVYAPNVQSGTEPSLYDVIGRRIFGQVIVKF